jgi:hypothetical protein
LGSSSLRQPPFVDVPVIARVLRPDGGRIAIDGHAERAHGPDRLANAATASAMACASSNKLAALARPQSASIITPASQGS